MSAFSEIVPDDWEDIAEEESVKPLSTYAKVPGGSRPDKKKKKVGSEKKAKGTGTSTSTSTSTGTGIEPARSSKSTGTSTGTSTGVGAPAARQGERGDSSQESEDGHHDEDTNIEGDDAPRVLGDFERDDDDRWGFFDNPGGGAGFEDGGYGFGDDDHGEEDDDEWDGALPMVLVNLTEMCHRNGKPVPEGQEAAEIKDALVDEILKGYRARTAHLFAARLAYHTTTHRVESDMADLSEILGGASFAVVPPPPRITGLPLEALWRAVARRTGVPCVDAVKEYIEFAQADVLWKADMAVEVEKLAALEAEQDAARQGSMIEACALREERERVAARLREKLSEKEREEIRGELERIREDLEVAETLALDLENEPPEGEMSLLEILVCVILERHPLIGDEVTEEIHLLTTQEIRNRVLGDWEKHFGRLPRASRALRESLAEIKRKTELGKQTRDAAC